MVWLDLGVVVETDSSCCWIGPYSSVQSRSREAENGTEQGGEQRVSRAPSSEREAIPQAETLVSQPHQVVSAESPRG